MVKKTFAENLLDWAESNTQSAVLRWVIKEVRDYVKPPEIQPKTIRNPERPEPEPRLKKPKEPKPSRVKAEDEEIKPKQEKQNPVIFATAQPKEDAKPKQRQPLVRERSRTKKEEPPKRATQLAEVRTTAQAQQNQIDFSSVKQALKEAKNFAVDDLWLEVKECATEHAGKYQARFNELKEQLEDAIPKTSKPKEVSKALEEMRDFVRGFLDDCVTVMHADDPNRSRHRRDHIEEGFLETGVIDPLIALKKACENVLSQMPSKQK